MIRKILAPTDLSKLSQVGVRRALTVAKHFDAEVTIYHVVNGDEIRKLGDRLAGHTFVRSGFPNLLETYLHTYEVILAQFVGQNFSDLLPSVKVEEKVELGSSDKNIVELAGTEKFDLIIMATRGKGGLSRLFLGSVTEQVIRNAPCPVVAIPPYPTATVGESENEDRFEPGKVSGYQALPSKSRSRRRYPYVAVGPIDIRRAQTKQKDQLILEERNGNVCQRR
jgi:nucleotide-binding universal stress UspA family protein